MGKLVDEFLENKLDEDCLIFWWQLLIKSEFLNDHVVVASKRLFKAFSHFIRVLFRQFKGFSLLLDFEDKPFVNLLHARVKQSIERELVDLGCCLQNGNRCRL